MKRVNRRICLRTPGGGGMGLWSFECGSTQGGGLSDLICMHVSCPSPQIVLYPPVRLHAQGSIQEPVPFTKVRVRPLLCDCYNVFGIRRKAVDLQRVLTSGYIASNNRSQQPERGGRSAYVHAAFLGQPHTPACWFKSISLRDPSGKIQKGVAHKII